MPQFRSRSLSILAAAAAMLLFNSHLYSQNTFPVRSPPTVVHDDRDFGALSGRIFMESATGAPGQSAGLPGVRIMVRRTGAGIGDLFFERTSSADGSFEFKRLRPGKYTVEVDRTTLPLGISGQERLETTVDIGFRKQDLLDIVIPLLPSVTGVVYMDTDGNHRCEPGKDEIVRGARVTANGRLAFTDDLGRFSFANMAPGRVSLLVTPPSTNIKGTRVVFDLDPEARDPRTVTILLAPSAAQGASFINAGYPPNAENSDLAEESKRPRDHRGQSAEVGRAARPTSSASINSLVKPRFYSKPPELSSQSKVQIVQASTSAKVADRPWVPFVRGPMIPDDRYQLTDSGLSGGYKKLMMATGSHLRGNTTGDELIDAFLVDSSKRYRVDPLLIYAQMGQESSYKLRARSNKGASGLMQLMPATARRMGVTDIYDPQQNIDGGVKYMRILLDMFNGDLDLALAGYNAGEGAVIKYGYQIPPYAETQDYVRRISMRYRSLAANSIGKRRMRDQEADRIIR